MTELDWAPRACALPTIEQPLREQEFGDLFASTLRRAHQLSPTRADLTLEPTSETRARDLTARESYIPAGELVIFGIVGLLGNLAAIAVLASDRGANMNLRAAFLEVVNDALGSVAVIAAAIVIGLTGWAAADAIAAMLIGVLMPPAG